MNRLGRSKNLLVRGAFAIALSALLLLSFSGTSKSNALDYCCTECAEAYQQCINNGGFPGDCCCSYLACTSGCTLWCPEVCPSCN